MKSRCSDGCWVLSSYLFLLKGIIFITCLLLELLSSTQVQSLSLLEISCEWIRLVILTQKSAIVSVLTLNLPATSKEKSVKIKWTCDN